MGRRISRHCISQGIRSLKVNPFELKSDRDGASGIDADRFGGEEKSRLEGVFYRLLTASRKPLLQTKGYRL